MIASLSGDDPPILTALVPGHVTITAGDGSADLTVYAAPLAPGSVMWFIPGDGSGVTGILPAVPSSTGVGRVAQVLNLLGTTARQRVSDPLRSKDGRNNVHITERDYPATRHEVSASSTSTLTINRHAVSG